MMTTYVEAIDGLLDEVQVELESLASKFALTDARTASDLNFERWRWDAPAISMSWINRATALHNSVNILVIEMSRMSIEVNAWKDVDMQQGRRLRYWRNQQTKKQYVAQEIHQPLARAVKTVLSWRESDLTNQAEIGA